jgi:cell division protein FtsL
MEANRRQNRFQNTGTSYIEGNTVRKLSAAPDIRREERQYEVPSPRRQQYRHPKTLSGINLASLLVLSVAIITTVYVCVDYLRLQTQVSQMDNQIISMEEDLASKTKENDAAYDAVNTAYDLDYVYKVAVEELGMVYPNKNTVITYQGSNDTFVRQYEDIPD